MRGMRHRPFLATALAAAAGAIVVSPAPAGVPLVDPSGTPYRWDLDTAQPNVVGRAVTYFADVSDLRDTINGPMSATGAIQAAVRAWEVPTTRIRFAADARPQAAAGRNGFDRVNWIGWSSTELGRATFAATFPTRNGSQIVDMDIVMNDRDFSWDTWAEGVPGDADIQALVTHEWGHAIGCEHVPLRASTMYFSTTEGVVSLRSLASDDAALIGSIYPNQEFLDGTGAIAGRVDVAGTKNDRAAHVVAVSVASGEPAASALTSPAGKFRIAGLPRGTYRVLAAPCHPLGNVMNSYWRSGSTGFLPAVSGTGNANPARADPVLVEKADEIDVGTIQVGTSSSPFEPNDSPAQAARIGVGDAVCARFESGADQDWYVFHADAGSNVTLKVLAFELGSDADPSLRLVDDTGATLRAVQDIRDSRFRRRIDGEDRDARIPAPGNALDAADGPWIVPATGDYRVRVGQDVPSTSSQSFYVLLVTVASDAPSPTLTDVVAAPTRVDADGVSKSTIIVRARTEAGDALGTGATATVFRNGNVAGTAAYSAADASFRFDMTAPSVPGTDVISASVSAASGNATADSTATIVWVGPMDPAASSLVADPRRIAADGVSQTAVRFVPRDAQDEALGPGRRIAVALDVPRGAVIGTAVSQDDGTYLVPITAGTEPGTSELSAKVDAQDAVARAKIAFGFGLAEVLTMAAQDVADAKAVQRLPSASAKALASAAKQLQSALAAANDAAHAPASELRALVKARSGLLAFATAVQRSKTRLRDPGTTREIALATRATAAAAIDRAAAEIRNARDQRRVDAARARLAKGDAALGAGMTSSAQARFLSAYRGVFAAL